MKKRILPLALALALVLGLMAIPAQAAGVDALPLLSTNSVPGETVRDFAGTAGLEAFQPILTVEDDTVLQGLSVYHYNSGAGATPGTISLYDNATRQLIGSWSATGSERNTWWTAETDVQLYAGKSYFIDCSDRETWSIAEGERGVFVYKAYGYVGTLPAAPVVTTPDPVIVTSAPTDTAALLPGYPLLYSNTASAETDFAHSAGVEVFQPVFSVSGTNVVLQAVSLCHFNGGMGAAPGTISLYDNATRALIGTWQATGRDGNIWWDAYPNVELETGRTYFFDCSDRETWTFGGGEKNFFSVTAYGYHVASGAPPVDLACYTFPSANVVVNGVQVIWPDHLPYINADSRTMTVLAPIASALGLTCAWDGVSAVASYSDGVRTLFFPVGSNCAYTDNGEIIHMDTYADMRDGAAFTPIRCLAEYFGYDVEWDGGSMTVYVFSPRV